MYLLACPLCGCFILFSCTGCEITAKAEHLNPGGSVKDRAALFLIKEAEEKGVLHTVKKTVP